MLNKTDLFSILKQKDANFVFFCKGLEGKVATDNDLAFFLNGEQEIEDILNEIDLRISVTEDEKEKERLLKEKASWLREREAYHKEIKKIQEKMKQKHQMASNGRFFLNEKERFNYARIIYLITKYDEEKQKLNFDENLADYITSLHKIQNNINLLYQAICNTKENLEEESVLPREKEESESDFEYENYVREFLGLEKKEILEQKDVSIDDLVSFMDTNEIPVEKEEIQMIESPVFEEPQQEVIESNDMDLFDFWLEPMAYQKMLENPWIQKIMETQNEVLGDFSKFIDPIHSDHKDYLNYQIGLLRNSALQLETEFMDHEFFKESRKDFVDNFTFYRDELEKRGYPARKTYLFSVLSSLFQAIYLYDRLKQNERENLKTLLNLRDKINTLSYSLVGIKELIARADLPLEEEKEETEIPFEENIPAYEEEYQKDSSSVSFESNIKEEFEKEEKEELKPVTMESEEDEKYASLLAKINELENRVNELVKEQEKSKQKGKPFKVIRKATNNILFFLNRHKILASAIGSLTVVMLGLGSINLTKNYQPVEVSQIKTELDQNDPILHYVVQEPVEDSPLEKIEEKGFTLEDVSVPHIADEMHPKLGIEVYPDQYVGLGREKENGHRVNYSPTTEMKIQKLGFMDLNSGIVYSSKSDEESLEFIKRGYQLVSCFDEIYGYFKINDVTINGLESGLGR